MGLRPGSCSFLAKVFELVLFLVMKRQSTGFSLGYPQAKVIIHKHKFLTLET